MTSTPDDDEESSMTDESGLPDTEPTGTTRPTGEAWEDVMARMSDLGEAVARWVRAAANEPDTKEKLDQVRAGIDDIGQKADAALGRAVRSELGQQVKEGAEHAGQAMSDAAQRVTDVAAPHVKNAFAGLSDVFGKAAARVDEATQRHSESAPPVEDASTAAPDVAAEDDPASPDS
jgi:hypothetical protein